MREAACVKIQTRKYKSRPSPPYHAQGCKGKMMKGNDGKKYKSVADSRGVYRWVLTARATRRKVRGGKTYEIIDNYARPFKATVGGGKVEVVATASDKVVFTTSYKHIFIGDNDLRSKGYAPRGSFPGNSILIHVSPRKYIYAGDQIYSFAPLEGDTIKTYYSPVGNNQVPYPYAVGEKYVYFMLDKVAVPAAVLDLNDDGYFQFYKLEGSLKTHPFHVKVLHPRVQ
jgi:hypothetical protein